MGPNLQWLNRNCNRILYIVIVMIDVNDLRAKQYAVL